MRESCDDATLEIVLTAVSAEKDRQAFRLGPHQPQRTFGQERKALSIGTNKTLLVHCRTVRPLPELSLSRLTAADCLFGKNGDDDHHHHGVSMFVSSRRDPSRASGLLAPCHHSPEVGSARAFWCIQRSTSHNDGSPTTIMVRSSPVFFYGPRTGRVRNSGRGQD